MYFDRKCKITYICHGATIYSDEFRFSDAEYYPPLNEAGYEEVEKICEFLKQRGVKNDKNEVQEGRETTMQCFYTIDGKGPVIYFDGRDFHPLAHPDEMNVLNMIYKANNGKDMPSYSWQSKAPWYKRLEDAMKRTK